MISRTDNLLRTPRKRSRDKSLSIVIVAYFSDDFITDCLSSIYINNDIDENMLEIIIVDNGPRPTDFLRNIIKKYKNVSLIENPKNGGFGQGNNIGADASSGEILLFLNPDTRFIEPVFSEIINIFDNNKIGAIGCQLVDSEGGQNSTYGYFPEKKNLIVSIVDKCIFKPLGYIPQNYIYPWGANLFVRRKDFYEAGKFDEEYFLCFEEADLCKRLKPKKNYICNKKIIHYEGHTIQDQSKRFDSWLRSLELYHKKHGYNLNRTLRTYNLLLLFHLLRCILSGQDSKDVRNMIRSVNELRKYSVYK